MVSLLLHETNEQGYHMSEWGITCLSPTKLIRLYLFVTKGVSLYKTLLLAAVNRC